MSLLPRISIPVGWHVHSCWTIAPVTVSFNHSVFCTFAHTPEKFYGNRIQDERDIIVFSVFCCLCCFSSVVALFDSVIPHHTLVKSSNPLGIMCVLSLHKFLLVGLAIGAPMAEMLRPKYLLLLLSRNQPCHPFSVRVLRLTDGQTTIPFYKSIPHTVHDDSKIWIVHLC